MPYIDTSKLENENFNQVDPSGSSQYLSDTNFGVNSYSANEIHLLQMSHKVDKIASLVDDSKQASQDVSEAVKQNTKVIFIYLLIFS